jgi:hypothetical protein
MPVFAYLLFPKMAAFDESAMPMSLRPIIEATSASALHYLLSKGSPQQDIKGTLTIVILLSLLAPSLAATDCEILNSGIPSIPAEGCCTATVGITCVDGRATVMYELLALTS